MNNNLLNFLGNYNGKQCVQGFCFCVDEFGRQNTTEVDQLHDDNLKCEDFCCEKDSYSENEFCYKFQNYKPISL